MALRIIRHTYRGCPGFLVCGKPKNNPGVFPTRIFVETRDAAEHIRDKVNRGEWIQTSDFAPRRKEVI